MNAAAHRVDDPDDDGPPPLPLDEALAGAPDEEALDDEGLDDVAPSGPGHAFLADLAPAPASDAQLAAWMAAIVDRDERALAALYDATVSRVFGLVQRIVRNAAMAEEVVEDAYFQVWRQAVRFDPSRGAAITWLLAMARSRAIDALRREARHPHDSLDLDAAHEVIVDAPPVDELLDLARHRCDLHQALMLLGAQPRQLVSMAFLRGLSHEEIAEQTQLPLGTVKSQIRRALLSLRQVLGARGVQALA